jgi:putative flippase GtrA
MGFFANTGTVWCLVELLLVPAWAAKVAAIAVSFVVNFSLSHFLVFRAQPRQNAD